MGRFMTELSGTGDVGIWHETYQVQAAGIETVYSGMPVFGLAKATTHVPIGADTHTARQRIGHFTPHDKPADADPGPRDRTVAGSL